MHKMQMYESLRDMLEREVTEIEKKGDLNEQSLDHLYKLMTAIKVADKCIDREKEEQGGSSFGSYARRGRDGDSDGRYNESRESRESRDSWGRSRDRSYDSYGSYGSYDSYGSYGNSRDAKREMVDKLTMLMEKAGNEQERNAIMDCIERVR